MNEGPFNEGPFCERVMARSDWLDPNRVMKDLLIKDHFISDDLALNPNGVL